MHYVGFIFGDESGGYGVTVPDIPGFTAHVKSGGISAAVETAQRVLMDHVAAMVDAGLEIPAARSPDDLEKVADVKAEWDEAEAFVMLRVVHPAGRTLRINVTMDENVLNLIDTAARERGLTRSAFIAEACRRFAIGEPSVVEAYGRQDLAPNVTARLEETMRRVDEFLSGGAARQSPLRRGAALARKRN